MFTNAFQTGAFQYNWGGNAVPIPAFNGREYQPTYYELKARRDIEKRFEDAELDLKANEIKIQELEFKRLSDLADMEMQRELMALLAFQQELQSQLDALEQQKLMALMDDETFLTLLMACPI